MNRLLCMAASLLILTACQDKAPKVDITPPEKQKPAANNKAGPTSKIKTHTPKAVYDAKAQFRKYAPVKMDDVDTSFLT